MKITADLTAGKLVLQDAVFPISNRVRTLKDGTRRSYEVVRSIPDGRPYDPMPFPLGLWNITGLDWQQEKGFDVRTYGPVKIRTDAWQWAYVWKLDGEGDYAQKMDQVVKDSGYWLHYSVSETTLGCIRLASPKDAIAIAGVLERVLRDGPVELEVLQ